MPVHHQILLGWVVDSDTVPIETGFSYLIKQGDGGYFLKQDGGGFVLQETGGNYLAKQDGSLFLKQDGGAFVLQGDTGLARFVLQGGGSLLRQDGGLYLLQSAMDAAESSDLMDPLGSAVLDTNGNYITGPS